AAVCVRRVEGADAERPRGVHQLERLLLRLALPEERGRGADAAEVAAAENEAGGVHRPVLAQAPCARCACGSRTRPPRRRPLPPGRVTSSTYASRRRFER